MNKIKLPNFIKKQPIAVACAVICVALGAAIYFCNGVLAEANDLLAQKKSEGEHLRENVTNGSKLDEQYASISQSLQAIEQRLVHADQLAINLQYFYEIESATQTKLADVRQGGLSASTKNAGKTNYNGVSYNLTVRGTYAQLLDFFRRVENGRRFARVSSLGLSGGDVDADSSTILSLTLNIELLGLP
jgi:hypothetical protein